MAPTSVYQWGQAILIVITICSVLGGLFLKYVKPRLAAWWAPYRDGIQGVKEMPVKLKEITDNQNKNHETIKAIGADVAMLTSTMRARSDANPHEAYFEFDNTGLLIGANKTYTRWVNREIKEILQHGWKNTIFWRDRERVIGEIEEAIVECRSLSIQYRLLDETLVESTMTPIPEGVMPCDKFVGVIRKVKADEQAVSHD